jgi:hypothetical protein
LPLNPQTDRRTRLYRHLGAKFSEPLPKGMSRFSPSFIG